MVMRVYGEVPKPSFRGQRTLLYTHVYPIAGDETVAFTAIYCNIIYCIIMYYTAGIIHAL